MAFLVDVLIVILIGLPVHAEIKRGLFFALFDLFRLAAAVVVGFAAYSAFHSLFHSYAAGFAALGIAALSTILLVPTMLRLFKADPAWARTPAGRFGAGLIGVVIGFLTVAVLVPTAGRGDRGRKAVMHSFLARPFVETTPLPYYVADALNLDFPMLDSRTVNFEHEGRNGQMKLVPRINYTRLNGSTCIECGARIRFDGYFVRSDTYFNRFGITVSPRFSCPQCGRTSDGCQTFEGFHRMYGRCPCDVRGPIDCGVWTNYRAVYPKGICPVCGRSVQAAAGHKPRAPGRLQAQAKTPFPDSGKR